MKLDWLPRTVSRDARILLSTRALRGFADGAVSVLLASYLSHLGLNTIEIGTIVTGTLLGSAALTLLLGLVTHRWRKRAVFIGACGLMVATGLGFAGLTAFWPLLLVAIVGTINPSAGDVTFFLPLEQSALSETVPAERLTAAFAWYNLAGGVGGGLGALASGVPVLLGRRYGWETVDAERFGFIVYAIVGLVVGLMYRALSPSIEVDSSARTTSPLSKSRSIVIRLSLLFSLDAFGGGFVVQSLLVLWLYRRFSLSIETAGAIFFVSGLLGAFSQLAAARLADRFGRIRTMVFTHLPANAMLILAALMPTMELAVVFLFLRAALSSMDVPARQSYVMAMVPPEERPAASSVTNVPRSLASAMSPLLAGLMLDRSTFGWPLICAGAIKVAYDLLLLAGFRSIRPVDESGAAPRTVETRS